MKNEQVTSSSRLARQSSFALVFGYLTGMSVLVMIVFWAQLATAENAKDSGSTEKPKTTEASKTSTAGKGNETPAAAPQRKEVLDPSQFAGLASFGYASAKAAPEVMEKLFCYCGCDLTDKHCSLLDCFTSVHGVDCHICQEEAVLALKLKKDGMPIAEIQKTIDEKYAHEYPFQEDTAAYKQYKNGRLYMKPAGSASSRSGKEVAGPEAPETTAVSENPHLKPGKKAGKCCGAGDHEHDKKDHSKQERTKS